MSKISEFRVGRHDARAEPHDLDGCYCFLQRSGSPEFAAARSSDSKSSDGGGGEP